MWWISKWLESYKLTRITWVHIYFYKLNIQIKISSLIFKENLVKVWLSNSELSNDLLPVISGLSGYHQIIHGINFDMELFLYGYPFCTPRIILVAFGPAESDESMTVKILFCDLPINVKIPVVVFIIFSLWSPPILLNNFQREWPDEEKNPTR